MNVRLAIIASLVGCSSPNGSADGALVDANVTATTMFDHFVVVFPDNIIGTTPILTPELLAGASAPASATVWENDGLGVVDLQTSATSGGYEQSWFSLFPMHAAAFGQVGVDLAPMGFAEPTPLTYDNGYAQVTLALGAAPVAVEVWGVPLGDQPMCARVELADTTEYFVRYDDRDCDGTRDFQDCNPDVYCDPSTTCPCP